MPRAVVSDEYMQSRKQHIPLGRIGDVQDMAEACMFFLSDDSSYIIGQDLRINGGSTSMVTAANSRVTVITGGGSGMDRQRRLRLARNGDRVCICDLNADAVKRHRRAN